MDILFVCLQVQAILKNVGDTKIKRTKSLLCEIFEHRGNKENSKWSERAA